MSAVLFPFCICCLLSYKSFLSNLVSLSILSFMFCAFYLLLNKIFLLFGYNDIFLHFSFEGLKFLLFTIRLLTRKEFMLIYGVR